MALLPETNRKLIGFFLFVGVIIATGFLIQYLVALYRRFATPENIKRIGTTQSAALVQRYGNSLGLKTNLELWKGIEYKQQVLINTTVNSIRHAGYVGPHSDGVFAEIPAVMTALSTGARLFVIEIGIDFKTRNPALIYRDVQGYKMSLNIGKVSNIMRVLSENAFRGSSDGTPGNVASTPFIVFLYFQQTPDKSKQPKEYVYFLAKVARALSLYKSNFLTQTPQGDFRNQSQESQIAFLPWAALENQMILITNADTTPFRSLDRIGAVGLTQDDNLDTMINARVYTKETNVKFGITTQPLANVKPSFVLTTPEYFLNVPPERKADAIEGTKSQYTICFQNDPEAVISPENLDKLYNEYGVHSIPYCHFSDAKVTNQWLGSGKIYEKAGYTVKPEPLRFIPPAPHILKDASTKTNSLGGMLVAPKL